MYPSSLIPASWLLSITRKPARKISHSETRSFPGYLPLLLFQANLCWENNHLFFLCKAAFLRALFDAWSLLEILAIPS